MCQLDIDVPFLKDFLQVEAKNGTTLCASSVFL